MNEIFEAGCMARARETIVEAEQRRTLGLRPKRRLPNPGPASNGKIAGRASASPNLPSAERHFDYVTMK